MNFAKPFVSEIDKPAAVEVEGNIRELTRGSAALRHADGGGLIAEVSLPYHTQNDLRTSAVAATA